MMSLLYRSVTESLHALRDVSTLLMWNTW